MDLWWSLVKMTGALVAVLGLMALTAYAARRWMAAGRVRWGSRNPMQVMGALTMGPRRQIALVAVGDTYLVVGVTTTQMSLLATLDPSAVPAGLRRAPDGERAA